jgi:hypothetical protein
LLVTNALALAHKSALLLPNHAFKMHPGRNIWP